MHFCAQNISVFIVKKIPTIWKLFYTKSSLWYHRTVHNLSSSGLNCFAFSISKRLKGRSKPNFDFESPICTSISSTNAGIYNYGVCCGGGGAGYLGLGMCERLWFGFLSWMIVYFCAFTCMFLANVLWHSVKIMMNWVFVTIAGFCCLIFVSNFFESGLLCGLSLLFYLRPMVVFFIHTCTWY